MRDDDDEGPKSLHRSASSISSRTSTRRSASRRLGALNTVSRTSSTPTLSGHRHLNGLPRSRSLLGSEIRSGQQNATWDDDDDESLPSKNNGSLADFLRQQNAAIHYNNQKSKSRRLPSTSSSVTSRSTQDPPAHSNSQSADVPRPKSERSDSISDLRKSLTEEYVAHSRRPVLQKASSKKRLIHSSVLDFFPLDTSCVLTQEKIHSHVVQMGLVTEEQLHKIVAAGFHFSVTDHAVPSSG
ncbi:hypothetical protein FisN_12Lh040 [Fistulifera solaris]|uniref:Uncharacterized protein n=1 Tax=Fistulifera solaris TaxID=1519565 RepID=A0A1Z5KGS9_FISSO|nr:hypothetical protein FisN_12Lh040 [Fistulifera solaris]|eukprot:GAX25503.1 hypothetical protein FisN_12Lh040 [Fistulifera solaris]